MTTTTTRTTEPAEETGAEVASLEEEIRQFRQRLQQPAFLAQLLKERLRECYPPRPLRMEDISTEPGHLLVTTPEGDAIFNAQMLSGVLASMVRNLPEPT